MCSLDILTVISKADKIALSMSSQATIRLNVPITLQGSLQGFIAMSINNSGVQLTLHNMAELMS